MDLGTAHTMQAVMADFIREGHFARHIRRMRPMYANRRRLLVAELERELGDVATIVGDEAGMHLSLFLPDDANDEEIAARAAKQSLLLSALSASYSGSVLRQGLVLGFGNTRESQIAPAVRQLAALVRGGHADRR
jgi:GntR family transcriptional regulator/MocR family aminotransferase